MVEEEKLRKQKTLVQFLGQKPEINTEELEVPKQITETFGLVLT